MRTTTKEKIIGIYKITNNINNKCYIGQSVNIKKRFYEHKYTNKTNNYLHNAMNKYGIENFSFEIIEECKKNKLSEREKYWIEHYNSTYPNGYNLTKGGEGGNTYQYRTEEQMKETKKKISQVTIGENNGMYGKHHSYETKEHLRNINLGKTLSEETKIKMSKSLQGHYMPEYAKQKISEATKRQWENEDFKILMTNRALGNEYAKGNKWNIGRIDIYHKDTLDHKRVFNEELDFYINKGYVLGIPPNNKRYNPQIRHCTNNCLVGVRFNKEYNKWQSYINYKKKRYCTKLFEDKQEAIFYRNVLENIFGQIKKNNIEISQVDLKKSIKQNEIVLYAS